MTPPAIRFMIGGVQKGGTTALAHYLGQHPQLRLPGCKEAHVFDAPDFDDDWTSADIDARFDPLFPDGLAPAPEVLHGDATPISIFHPAFVHRIARYNPAMRWIVLLRDPVERAFSQYYMEYGRGDERLPLPLALLAERWRLRGHEDDFGARSPLRHHSYLARGRYVRQLDTLLAAFPADQILLLRSFDLRRHTDTTVSATLRFLDVDDTGFTPVLEPVFTGDYANRRWPRLLRPFLRRHFKDELDALDAKFGLRFHGNNPPAQSSAR